MTFQKLLILSLFTSLNIYAQDSCSELTQDECMISPECEWTVLQTENGFFEVCIEIDWNGDDGGDNMDFCREFDEAMCEEMPFCEWTDEGCVMSSFGDDGGWDDFNCEEITNIEECYQVGCEWSTIITPNGIFEMCINPDSGDDEGGENDGPPDCLLDCFGIDDVNPDDDPYGACDWIISNFGPNNFFNQCAQDCDGETMMMINQIAEACFDCLSDENIDCADIWVDDEEYSCSDLSQDECLSVENCEWIPSNNPVESGYCIDVDPGGDDGGTGGSEGCFEDDEWYCYGCELFINECEYYECTEDGWIGPFIIDNCWNSCVEITNEQECWDTPDCVWVFDNPLSNSGYCMNNDNQSEGEAVLSLEYATGVPGGMVSVPLVLSNFESVSGLQFSFSFDSPYNNEPALNVEEFEILDNCFSGSYNQINNQMIGIVFSLEGCVYEPSDSNHIGNILVYINDDIPTGSELPLEFIYTLVSNPSGNEIPSYGEGSSIIVGIQGDVNFDGEINVLDIVTVVNFAIYLEEPNDSQFWASDINYDGQINILDIVQLINIILDR